MVFALAVHVPTLQVWLGTVATADVTIGGTVMVLMASVFLSVILNGARFLVYERVCGIEEAVKAAPINEAARREAGVEAALDHVVLHHYAYYQFYGATSIAWPLAVLLAIDLPVTWPLKIGGLVAAALVEYILCASANDAMRRFLTKRASIVQFPPTSRSAHEQRPTRQNQRG